jgi:hypothetical protein
MAEHLWPGASSLPGPRSAQAPAVPAAPATTEDHPERQDPDHLALHVYQCVQRGENRAALDRMAEAQTAAAERPGLLARLLAWEAQAAAALGEGPRARQALRKAKGLAQAEGDAEGEAAITALQAQLMQRLMAAKPPPADTTTALGAALAAFDRGDAEAGLRHAHAAYAQATADNDPREQVLALLAIARSPPHAIDAIATAAGIADASDDFNLVTAVSKAAKMAGLALPTLEF